MVKILQEKHGRIENIVLCKDEFRETNEMLDVKKTLKDYGIEGSCLPVGGDSASCVTSRVVIYNFKPIQNRSQDTVLLSWMN